MDISTTMTLIGAILGSSALTTIIVSVINRKKTQAETKQITVSSEIELSGATLSYAKEVKTMLDDLKKDYSELKAQKKELEKSLKEWEEKYEELSEKYTKAIYFLEKLGYKEDAIK